jgi:type IV pilus assembly protein PilE
MRSIRPGRRYASPGFTLIELMVTIVVLAILVSIAVPSYTSQLRKSRRTEARTALLDLASREERYNSTHSVYSSTPADLGLAGAYPIAVGSGYYQVTVCVSGALPCAADAGNGTAFLLTATPVPGSSQAGDSHCGSFTLDNTGVQAVTGAAGASTCWN